jgi:hypothetical protein
MRSDPGVAAAHARDYALPMTRRHAFEGDATGSIAASGASDPGTRSAEEDEDGALELPAFDGADEDPGAALGLDADADADGAEDEGVGLDTTEGTEEPVDAEWDPSDADEATRWSIDGEDARDLDTDADLPAGDEYGWTDQNEPIGGDDFEDEEDDPGEAFLPGDRGEEGLDDGDATDGDLASLPPLDSGPEDEDPEDPFALDLVRDLTGSALPEDPEPTRGHA